MLRKGIFRFQKAGTVPRPWKGFADDRSSKFDTSKKIASNQETSAAGPSNFVKVRTGPVSTPNKQICTDLFQKQFSMFNAIKRWKPLTLFNMDWSRLYSRRCTPYRPPPIGPPCEPMKPPGHPPCFEPKCPPKRKKRVRKCVEHCPPPNPRICPPLRKLPKPCKPVKCPCHRKQNPCPRPKRVVMIMPPEKIRKPPICKPLKCPPRCKQACRQTCPKAKKKHYDRRSCRPGRKPVCIPKRSKRSKHKIPKDCSWIHEKHKK